MSHSSSPHRDAADRPAASFRPNLAAEIDTMEDRLLELVATDEKLEEHVAELVSRLGVDASPGTMRVVVAIAAGVLRKADDRGTIQELFGTAAPVREDLGDFVHKLMGIIDEDRNPRLQAKCADFVLSLGLNGGVTQTEIAAEEGVTKATVSARCRKLVRKLGRTKADGSAPARGMKSEAAVEAYSKRQTGKVAKPAREPWSFSGILGRVFEMPMEAAYGNV